MMTRSSGRISTGTLAVLVMLGAGVLAGAVAVVYWMGVIERTWPTDAPAPATPSPDPAAPPAAAALDPDARADLEAMRQVYMDVRQNRADLPRVLTAARNYAAAHPTDPQGHLFVGQVAMELGDYPQALAAWQRCLELDPQQTNVHLLAGSVALGLDQLDAAQQHFQAALALEPNHVNARLNLAQLHLRRQQRDEARRLLHEALALDSSAHAAHAALADLYAQQGDLDLAIHQITRAIDLTPAPDAGKLVLYLRKQAALLRQAQRPVESLQALQSLPVSERSKFEVLEEMAACWEMLQQPRRAAALYEQLMLVSPNDWRLPAAAARWRLRAGDRAEAQTALDAWRRLQPQSSERAELQEQVSALPPTAAP